VPRSNVALIATFEWQSAGFSTTVRPAFVFRQGVFMADANANNKVKTVLEFAKQHDAKILDLRFTDIPGLWHHVSYPIEQLTESSLEDGFGIDGSSIRGWAGIHESDMLLKPDTNFHLLDPFTEVPTLVLVCDVVDPVT
jgi:glutamine synthetase